MITETNAMYDAYYKALNEDTECPRYLYSPTPLVVEQNFIDRINHAVSLMLDVIDTQEHFDHCLQLDQWSLPVSPMRTEDYTGSADFLLTTDGAKLIEMNINLPGMIGLIQEIGNAARKCLNLSESNCVNHRFNEDLVATFKSALPERKKTAILASHLPSSLIHYPHYRHFSRSLNKLGLQTTLVPANEITVTEDGCMYNGEHFDSFINLVIPFVWEANPESFTELTKLLRMHGERIVPNPTGSLLGTKDLLSYLSSKRNDSNSEGWRAFVLHAQPLNDYETLDEVLSALELDQMVLKPYKDYGRKGVFVQPDLETLKDVFYNKKEDYMLQEYTDSVELPVILPSREEVTSHSVMFRVHFASKKAYGHQAHYIVDAFNTRYYSAPVVVN